MSAEPLPDDWDDNPEWTEEDFAKARPASDFLSPEHLALLVRKPGRPVGSDKERIGLRVDREVVEHFRAGGRGWQSRMNAALRKAAGL